MTKSAGKHLTKENREVIEDGLASCSSASTIAKRLSVSTSTVTREVKANRQMRERKVPKSSTKCVHYRDCAEFGTACPRCGSCFTECRHCKTRSCVDRCPKFERIQCPETERWPFTCPSNCAKRSRCGFPRYSYRAHDADDISKERLSSSRSGIDLTQEELERMRDVVVPLVKNKGQSFEAVWATHGDELPVCVRTAYAYQAAESWA